VGVATSSHFSVNRLNPATFADATYSTMDVSGFGHLGSFRNSSGANAPALTANFQTLGFVFPSNKNLSMALGFAPTSLVGYNINHRSTVAIEDTTYNALTRYAANGGLNQAYMGFGGRFWHKKLQLGGALHYTFGQINYTWLTAVSGYLSNAVIFERNTYLRGAGGQIGAIFVDTLFRNAYKALPAAERGKRMPVRLRVGATADYTLPLRGDMLFTGETSVPVTQGNTLRDTLQYIASGSVQLPARVGVGFELGRLAAWSIAGDVTYQDWRQFKELGSNSALLGRDLRAAIGGEWIPNFVGKYFARVSYRAGAHFHQSSLIMNALPVNDVGISLGAGFPPARGTSSLNIALVGGKRGSLAIGQPLEEFYLRLQVGVCINERWFVRRVVD
jgi:hypothetical protein